MRGPLPQNPLAAPQRLGLSARVGLLLSVIGMLPALLAGQEVSFHLVPESSWVKGQPRLADEVKTGTVELYREGAYAPQLVVPAGDGAHTVPPGRWLWIAHAPGYVSVGSGVLEIPVNGRKTAAKVVVWPVVPACELATSADRRWKSMDRLDLVSISYSTVYPLDPKKIFSQQIPAGRYLAYAVGARGLLGISRVSSCRAGERQTIQPPPTPAASRQDFLVPVILPDDQGIAPQALAIAFTQLSKRATAATTAPTAAVWNGRRGSFFFLGVSATGPLELVIQHTKLRTRTLAVDALGGSVRELPSQLLKRRRSLRFMVNYQPLREHRSAKVVGFACGRRHQESSVIDVRRCRALGRQLPLAKGPTSLLVDNLDDGQYQFDAVVDDEVVSGLGNHFAPYLDPETDDAPIVQPMQLPELEIYGNLLLKDKPVPGEVHLWPNGGGTARRFATDRELLFHLFYFGYLADRYALNAIPEDLRHGDPAAMRGLYDFYTLEACGKTGSCRLFNVHSTLTGGGRLDLDLGSGLGLDIEVVSKATGEPIGGVLVGADRSDPALHFVDGEVEWRTPVGREGQGTYTDDRGQARIRNLKPGSVSVGALKAGFKLQHAAAEVREGVRTAVRIELEPNGGGATMLRFADGAPVGQAYLLVLDAHGVRQGGCSRATGSDGSVDLPASCLDAMRLVLLHPEAAVTSFAGSDWLGAHDITVDRAPVRPVQVRISDAQGRPLAGVPVEIRYRDFALEPDDLLLAATYTGTVLFYLTDDQGEATLQGIDPADVDLPEVAIAGGASERKIKPVPLAGTPPGGTVEIVLPN